MKFNSETGAQAGRNSSRGKDTNAELIRKGLTGKLDINALFDEIETLEINDRVTAKIKLLAFVLPKLQSIDLTVHDLSVKEYLQMDSRAQDQYINSIMN